MRLAGILLFGVMLFAGTASALNLEANITLARTPAYDNQTTILLITVYNNELTFAAEKLTFKYEFGNKSFSEALGDVRADGKVEKQIELGRLPAGAYAVDWQLSYSFLDTEDATQIQHYAFRILPSKEVTMKTRLTKIDDITVSKSPSVSAPFSITYSVNASEGSKIVEVKLDSNEALQDNITDAGSFSFSKTLSTPMPGNHQVTISVFSTENGGRVLEDTKTISVFVASATEYASVTVGLTLPKTEGEVKIEQGTNTVEKLISDVGCFITGCKSDFLAPSLRDISFKQEGDTISITAIADDSGNGNSKISACAVRIGSNWTVMTASDGTLDSATEKVEARISSSTYSHKPEFDCVDEFGNHALTVEEYSPIPCACGFVENNQCNKYACCSNSDCSEFSTCSLDTHTCIEKTDCTPVITAGDPARKINIAFIGVGFKDYSELKTEILKMLNYDESSGKEGFLSLEPIKNYKQKFNFYMLNSKNEIPIGPSAFFNDWPGFTGEPDFQKAISFAAKCDVAKYKVILSRENYRSYASGGIVTLSMATGTPGLTLAHELGHSIFHLADEYVEPRIGNNPHEPNCAPTEEIARQWWGDLVGKPDIGFFKGCSYIPDNIRPTDFSLMGNMGGRKPTYGQVNSRYIEQILSQYS